MSPSEMHTLNPSSSSYSTPIHTGTQSHRRTLRERRGVTFFIIITPPNFGGPPKGHLEPTVGNLPRRRRKSAVVNTSIPYPPAILDDSERREFFASVELAVVG
ncbi:hypothetical protein D9615_009007 [Tricholomella constricta]|uniref:Uncharacterized protein n=1 Tax=Tricholomella constricta TaxID=117010 RepID=A0A8H5H0V1_9AGAR|nr:hypothetical protein D9615_009007 [Tricholomella constricta]